MRRRALLPAVALALLGPAPLLLSPSSADTPPRAQCGTSSTRPAAPAAAPGTGGQVRPDHHKPDHPRPPSPPPSANPKPKPPSPPPPPPPPSVTVATANLLDGRDDLAHRTLDARLSMQADQLAALGVDAVGAQEVSRTSRHGWVVIRLAAEMARRTGTRWYWCYFASSPHVVGEPETRDGGGGIASDVVGYTVRPGEKFESGIAVLSRYPVLHSEVRRLSLDTGSTLPACRTATCAHGAVFDGRAALRARLATPIGEVDLVTAQTGGTQEQSGSLADFANAGGRPAPTTVVACDCATVEGTAAYSTLRRVYVDAFRAVYPRSGGYTTTQALDANTATVRQRSDFVFVRGARPASVRVGLNAPYQSTLTSSRLLWPSDHYAVLATLVR